MNDDQTPKKPATAFAAPLAARDRALRARRQSRSPSENLRAMAEAQQQAFACLEASPDGVDRFIRRNIHNRRARYVDGEWQPVSPDRRSQRP